MSSRSSAEGSAASGSPPPGSPVGSVASGSPPPLSPERSPSSTTSADLAAASLLLHFSEQVNNEERSPESNRRRLSATVTGSDELKKDDDETMTESVTGSDELKDEKEETVMESQLRGLSAAAIRGQLVKGEKSAKVDRPESSRARVYTRAQITRGEEIFNLLSDSGGSDEAEIRGKLGNDPDTSIALRMLIEQGRVRRIGRGGRQDAYFYQIAD